MSDNDPNIFFAEGVLQFQEPELWECTPILRWRIGVLQQLWAERTTGKHEWRDVPQAEETE